MSPLARFIPSFNSSVLLALPFAFRMKPPSPLTVQTSFCGDMINISLLGNTCIKPLALEVTDPTSPKPTRCNEFAMGLLAFIEVLKKFELLSIVANGNENVLSNFLYISVTVVLLRPSIIKMVFNNFPNFSFSDFNDTYVFIISTRLLTIFLFFIHSNTLV